MTMAQKPTEINPDLREAGDPLDRWVVSDFHDLLCVDDPADAPASLAGYLYDLLVTADAALSAADQHTADRIILSVTGVLHVAISVTSRIQTGCDALEEETRRGIWRGRRKDSAEESPVMQAFHVWKGKFDNVEAAARCGWSDDELGPHHGITHAALQKLVQMPARNAQDVCAKLTAFTCNGEGFADDGGALSSIILREARDILISAEE